MTNLSYAQIEQRRAAARSRWQKAGVVVGTGLLFGLGAHGASTLVRKKIADVVSTRLASKIGQVSSRVTAFINNKEASRLDAVDKILASKKKQSRANPEKIIMDRLKQLDLFENRIQTFYQKNPYNFSGKRTFVNPLKGMSEDLTEDEANQQLSRARRESEYLDTVKLPKKVHRKATIRRPKNQPNAVPRDPVRATKTRLTSGRMSKEEIAKLRTILYAPSSTKAARIRTKIIQNAMGERRKNAEMMERTHARLRSYYARRGYTKRKAAIVTGASVLGGGVVGYNLSSLQKADTTPTDPTFAAKIQQAFESLKSQTQEMIYNVANGLSPFDLKLFQDKLKTALEPLTDYFLKGIAEGIASERPKYVNVRFDLLQPVIFSHLDGSRAQLIVNLSEEQRNNITKAITEGLAAGHAPAKIALTIRPGIGLTENQAQFVANYKNDLVLNNSNALARALRDKRYDRTVAKAIKTGVPLSNDQINKLTDAYGRKFLSFRANTIARDQSLAAVNLGHVSTIKEVASKHGLMVEKTWIATHDSRTREAHRELDGKTVIGVDTPFQSELGPIRYPYDPQASAADTIQCRCHMKFKLMPMNQIKDVSQ